MECPILVSMTPDQVWERYPELSRAFALVVLALSGQTTEGRILSDEERLDYKTEAWKILARIGRE